MREQYEKYKFIHKRGILMFGEPGCGKSGIIQMVSKKKVIINGKELNTDSKEFCDYLTDEFIKRKEQAKLKKEREKEEKEQAKAREKEEKEQAKL